MSVVCLLLRLVLDAEFSGGIIAGLISCPLCAPPRSPADVLQALMWVPTPAESSQMLLLYPRLQTLKYSIALNSPPDNNCCESGFPVGPS